MGGVLVGFAVIGAIVLLGFVIGRSGVLGERGPFVLGRLVFFALMPCLLFTVLAEADVHLLFSSLLVVSAIAAVVAFAVFALVALVLWKRPVAQATIGSLAAGYVNANNIGIPVSLYVLGSPGWSAPIVLFQLLVVTPVALGILDAQAHRAGSFLRRLRQQLANPIIIGAVLGVLVAVAGVPIPEHVFEPFRLVGAATIPVVLIAFGMSLSGSRLLAPGTDRRDVLLATGLKSFVMPLVAWAVGTLFGLEGHDLFVVVVLAALPSAQNVFNFAQRYEQGEVVARDTVLLTTVLAVPVLLGVAVLLAA